VVVLRVLGDEADVGKNLCRAGISRQLDLAALQNHRHSRICLNIESSDFDIRGRGDSLGVSLSSKQSASSA